MKGLFIHSVFACGLDCTLLSKTELKLRRAQPNKTLQATAAVLLVSAVVEKHNAVVAGASALPAAVPELGR